jgi:hypothetical protein
MTIDPLTAWHSSTANLQDPLLAARLTPEHSTGDLVPFVVDAAVAARRPGRPFSWLTSRLARPAVRHSNRWAGQIADAAS